MRCQRVDRAGPSRDIGFEALCGSWYNLEVGEANMELADTVGACAPPIRIWENGAPTVTNSPVRLEDVIYHFNYGHPRVSMVYSFPVLKLADVYAVIANNLRKREIVDAWSEEEDRKAEEFR